MSDFAKIPPQAVDLEKAVLGAIMVDAEALPKVIDLLSPDSFYQPAHKQIYTAIQQLYAASSPIDILTVKDRVSRNGALELVGGAFYITDLTTGVASSANIETHAMLVQQAFLGREMIRICSVGIDKGYDTSQDIFAAYQSISEEMFKRFSINSSRNAKRFSQIFTERLEQYNKPADDGITGINTGYECLNRITGGWQKSDLVIIAGRPGMGKTAFVLNTARHAAVDFDKPVVVFSLEMSDVQLVDRIIPAETEIYHDKFKKGALNDFEINKVIHSNRLIDSQIFIDDTPQLSIFEFRAKCRRLKSQYDIQMIIVDYLQLMRGEGGGNREQEISSISRTLKAVAKELDVPVLALSQLSRGVESRAGINGKRPMLSDLRESGSIEQDADMVLFLYRPEYYGVTEDENGNALPPGATEIIFAKNRSGPLDTGLLIFNGGFMSFKDPEPVIYSQQSNLEFTEISLKPNTSFDETPF